MRKLLLSTFFLMFLFAGNVSATTLTSEINMDNAFEINISTDDTIAGSLINSTTYPSYNWETTITDTIELTAGVDYYLHIKGIDAGGIGGFLGEFNLSGIDHAFANGTSSLLTNITDWDGNNTGWGDSYVSTLTDLGANGVDPWGTISEIPNGAHWIWAGDVYSQNNAYFSTMISANPVPEPATMLLFGIGILGLAGINRREK